MTRHIPFPGRMAALATVAVLLAACNSDADKDASSGEDSPTSSPTSSPSGDLVQATLLADLPTDAALAPGRYAMGFSSDQADTPMVLIEVPDGYLGGRQRV